MAPMLMVSTSTYYPGRYWNNGNYTPRFYSVTSSVLTKGPKYPFSDEGTT